MAAWVHPSPMGDLTLIAAGDALTELRFGASAGEGPLACTPVIQKAAKELDAYFAGTLREFTIPLAPVGTAFQQAVWQALCKIPYGETASYGQIAERVGNPKASRAVGMANNRNPLPIMIPCHRVIGKDGSMVGYGSGLPIKQLLLSLEKRVKEKGDCK